MCRSNVVPFEADLVNVVPFEAELVAPFWNGRIWSGSRNVCPLIVHCVGCGSEHSTSVIASGTLCPGFPFLNAVVKVKLKPCPLSAQAVHM